MLHIFTDNKLVDKPYIKDVDAEFEIDAPNIENKYTDAESIAILKEMEGMTSRNGSYVDCKFGTVKLTDISSGCKNLLLCISRGSKCIINIDEMGYNAIKILFRIAKSRELDVVSHRVIKYIDNDYEATVNGETNIGEDITYALAELLGKEVY